MKSITKLEFINYKAFYDRITIDLSKYIEEDVDNTQNQKKYARNAIIYGENGSGKSSLYEGLKQFFLSSIATENVELSRNLKVNEFQNDGVNRNDVSIKATFTDYVLSPGLNRYVKQEETKTFGLSQRDTTIAGVGGNYIANANKLKAFLSYRELLRTHFMDEISDRQEFKLKFAQLLVVYILSTHTNTATNNTFEKDWIELNRSISRERKILFLANWDRGFRYEIDKVNLVLNFILKYFDPNLQVTLISEPTRLDGNFRPICSVDIQVNYYGVEIENHITILNEARLSALAISIYFSALTTNPQNNAAYKILFLDDIFVGLDMSNRLPLLQILSEFRRPSLTVIIDPESGFFTQAIEQDAHGLYMFEATPFFNTYQIFLTTYDRHWFEIANYYLDPNKWVSVEMYKAYNESINYEVPIVFSPSLNYFEKAIQYYRKGNKDYPAAGNYLRKEFERVLKNLLYGKFLLKEDSKTGEITLIEELGELWNNFYSSNGSLLNFLDFEKNEYKEFAVVSKTVLNPLSHDNLSKPIYKSELETAFTLIEKLKEIEKVKVIDVDAIIRIDTYNQVGRKTFLKVQDEVWGYRQILNKADGSYEVKREITPIKVKPVRYEEAGLSADLRRLPECGLVKAYNMVYHDVFGIKDAATFPNFNIYDEFFDETNGVSLQYLKNNF